MVDFDWKEKYKSKITTAEEAMKLVKSGDHIFIGTACAQPQHLVAALVEHSAHLRRTYSPYAHYWRRSLRHRKNSAKNSK